MSRRAHRLHQTFRKGARGLAGYGYTTVAEEYQGNRSRLYSAGKEKSTGKKDSFSRTELLRWVRLLVCAAIFLAMVVTKVNMPERFEELRAVVSGQMSQSVDYREVFSAVGRAVGGEATVQQSLNDVYMEVFHPAQNQNQAVETAVTVPLTDLSQQEPVNALLAFSQDWADCGAYLYRQGIRNTQQSVSAAVQATEVAESAPPAQVQTEQQQETENSQAAADVVYNVEDLPDGVCMEQRVLGISYTTPVAGWLSSPFGFREHPIEGEEKFHRGLDIAAAEGSTIVSFADGTVKATGESSSLGKYIMVSHGGNLTTIYAHCSKITACEGTKVKKGEKIAEVGHTGLATGSHLHFAIQQGETYLNPIYYVTLEEAP